MSVLKTVHSPQDLKALPTEQLPVLAAEIRDFLVNRVSETGGHLASNLGVVELTIGLHRVFDSPADSIVFDVGHQSYVHKILTGRQEEFASLRKHGGLSGFPKVTESPHDAFNSGHASNSISVAAGIAEANRLQNNGHYAVAVLGDGALTGGLAYEAMNNAGRSKSNLIVILNDNEMSISHNVGSMTNYLNRLRTGQKYMGLKRSVKEHLTASETGNRIFRMLNSVKDGVRHLLLPDTLFENLGFTYIGPIDGHDMDMVLTVLERAKNLNKPVFIHAYTKKGKGYGFAEQAPDLYHGTGPFDKEKAIAACEKQTYSAVAGKALLQAAAARDNVVAISAAMTDSTGLKPFSEQFAPRFFDVGISEGHAVTFGGGLAAKGYFPAVCIYSTFMQRAYDNIVHDMALQPQVSALLCLDRAGLVGEDGETHHGVFDIAYLAHIPRLQLFAPYTAQGVEAVIRHATTEQNGIYAVRYPRGEALQGNPVADIFEPEQLRSGDKVTVVSVSRMTGVLADVPFNGDHFHLNCIKPIRTAPLIKSLQKTGRLITVEDHAKIGGMGSLVVAALHDAGFDRFVYKTLGIPDRFVPQGTVTELLCDLGLDAKALKREIEEFSI